MTDREKKELKDSVISIFKIFNILDHTATIGGLKDNILRHIDSLEEESASVWHNASEEPDDKSNCLIYYTVGGKVSYRDIFPVLYNKDVKEFVSEPYPHPTGYKVEQKSLDGGCVAEVFKNVRDRFPLSDIYKWAYIDDLLKF